MKTCKYCQKEFEPYQRTIDCWNCEDGEAERYNYGDYSNNAPVFVPCTCKICNGTGAVEIMEDEYCSDRCHQEWMQDQLHEDEY